MTPVTLATLAFMAQAYWPTGNWREATPESQGLDSRPLAEALDHIRDKRPNIHSLLIVRHGYVVLDATFYPYQRGLTHDVASVSKSVTSALVGIAIDRGEIKSATQAVVPLLAKTIDVKPDARRDRLAVEHLLSMTPGLECGFRPGEQELGEMRRTEDWAAFAINLPMRGEPGHEFGYCSPGYHLLSTLISLGTGMSELEYARRYLLAPLGIKNASWSEDPTGRTFGWGDLHLAPRDMAKIGYLYLHGGEWDGQQVISKAWVEKSITPFVRVREGTECGYGWWLYNERRPRVYEANGRGGQRISVVPDEDMIVVFTGGGFEPGDIAPFIGRALRSAGAIPENPGALRALRQRVAAALEPPSASATSRVPRPGARIIGQTWTFDSNPIDFESLRFEAPDRIALKVRHVEYSTKVGLDGRYRFTPGGPHNLPLAAQGRWETASEFVLDLNSVANINHYTIRLRFEGEKLQATVDEATGLARNLKVAGRSRY